LYDVARQKCEGTWSATRGGIELVQGSCNNSTIVPDRRGHDFTVEQVDLIYLINDRVAYIRPTLKQSPFLFAVFAFQPIMTLIILGLSVLLHTTPMDKGFGPMSILWGIDRGSLDGLSGAALSGELIEIGIIYWCKSDILMIGGA
jgi:hypothetical protein